MKLNLGCGPQLLDGYLNIDKEALHSVGDDAFLQLDLEEGKLPFEDNSIEKIRADQILEHIHNLIPLMNECHRVLKPRGIFNISVPYYPHVEAFQDPTHVRFFTARTFGYFAANSGYSSVGETYGIKKFSYLKQEKDKKWEWNLLVRLIK